MNARMDEPVHITIRVPRHLVRALDRLYEQEGRSYGIRRALTEHLEQVEDYILAQRDAAKASVEYWDRLLELNKKHHLHLSDEKLKSIRRRAEQTKLHGFNEAQQRSWMNGVGIPFEQHAAVLEMLREAEKA